MEFITDERQLAEFTKSKVGSAGESALSSLPDLVMLNRVSIPLNSRFQALLARAAHSWIVKSKRSYLKIEEWGIWPSEEDIILIKLVLKGLGIEASFRGAAPFGFEFLSDERDLSSALFRLSLIFGWGGILIGERRDFVLLFSHDGWIQLGASDPNDLTGSDAQLRRLVDSFKPV